MILRKPYALLIRYFKLIHIILALPIIFLTFRWSQIVSFLNQFVASGYLTRETNLAGTYISFSMIISTIVIILAAISVFILLRRKDKGTKFYIAIIIYYVIFAIVLFMSYGILDSLEMGSVDATTARTIRDVAVMIYYPQFFYIIYTLIRGIGFDIKSFNFKADLAELEIDEKDSEEFELNVGFEDYKLKRYFRRSFREFKYYMKENAFILTCLGIIAGVSFGVFAMINFVLNNKEYKENQTFSYSGFTINVKESIISAYDYGGNAITKDKNFLAVRINITNKSDDKQRIKMDEFRLLVDNEPAIFPIADRGLYFFDYGIPYIGQDIAGGESRDYVLVYEVNPNANKYLLQLVDSLQHGVDEIAAKYKQSTLKPFKIDSSKLVGTYTFGEIISFRESNLRESTFKINSYNIEDNYKYTYDYCYDAKGLKCIESTAVVSVDYSVTGNSRTLLILDANLEIDNNSLFAQGLKRDSEMLGYLGRVKYIVNGVVRYSSLTDKTPRELSDKLILQTSASISEAEYIELQITVRNKLYAVILKDRR